MAYIDNQSKMMLAVLNDEQLMKIGEYSPADIPDNIYTALDSDNCIINAVAIWYVIWVDILEID